MKQILVIRHANWDFINDQLIDEGRDRCAELKPKLGPFTVVLSSPLGRTQETANLLSGKVPTVDERAAILNAPPEFGPRIAELRKTHPYGVAGAIISIAELREPLRRQGEALKSLVVETLAKIEDDEQALIVSHDGTMVGLEKVLTDASFEDIDHTYGELEGFRVNENLELTKLI